MIFGGNATYSSQAFAWAVARVPSMPLDALNVRWGMTNEITGFYQMLEISVPFTRNHLFLIIWGPDDYAVERYNV